MKQKVFFSLLLLNFLSLNACKKCEKDQPLAMHNEKLQKEIDCGKRCYLCKGDKRLRPNPNAALGYLVRMCESCYDIEETKRYKRGGW